MKRTFPAILLASAATLLSMGCSTPPRQTPPKDQTQSIERVTPGTFKTLAGKTPAEVLGLFGKPNKRAPVQGGGEEWEYVGGNQQLIVLFEEGVVEEWHCGGSPSWEAKKQAHFRQLKK
jgi:hypothetical protein